MDHSVCKFIYSAKAGPLSFRHAGGRGHFQNLQNVDNVNVVNNLTTTFVSYSSSQLNCKLIYFKPKTYSMY